MGLLDAGVERGRLVLIRRWPVEPLVGWSLALAMSMGGCGLWDITADQDQGASILAPDHGVLVIAAGDTLRGSMTAIWPLSLKGTYLKGQFEMTTSSRPSGVGFFASPRQLDGSTVPQESSVWKMWLGGEITQGSHRFDIGESVGGDAEIPSQTFTLYVVEESTFLMEIEPQTLAPGASALVPVRIIRPPSFSAPVQLSLRSPAGFTGTFTPNPVEGETSTLELEVEPGVHGGVYGLHVDGTGGGFSGTRTFNATVRDTEYLVRLSPAALSLSPGQIATATVDVSGSTFLPAALSATSPEPNTLFGFSPSTTHGTSILSVSAGISALPGTYQVAVTATFANSGVESATLELTITPQTGWAQGLQAPTLNAMDVDDGTQIGLAVGYGDVYRSTDGGSSWSAVLPIDANSTFNSVSLKVARAVAVGQDGVAAVSTDGGLTWADVSTGTVRTLYGVAFSDVANGLAVGDGIILRTTDGGASWDTVPAIGSPFVFVDVAYRAGTALAVGLNGAVFRSTSYQDNWVQLDVGTSATLWGVSLADADHAMIVGGGGAILYTSDGGANWVPRGIPGTVAPFHRVFLLSPTVATIGGLSGRIYQTQNAGTTWTQDPTPFTFERVWDFHLADDNRGVCLVQDSQLGGVSTFLTRQ